MFKFSSLTKKSTTRPAIMTDHLINCSETEKQQVFHGKEKIQRSISDGFFNQERCLVAEYKQALGACLPRPKPFVLHRKEIGSYIKKRQRFDRN